MNKTVVLAMSGGIDSTVALSILIENGYIVKGITMQNGYLSSKELSKAEQVAKKFNVDWEVLSIEKEFADYVINPFINDYKKGLTPNPCALCNKTIKFGFLFDIMQKKFPDSFYATGHYAIIAKEKGSFFIKEAKDKRKDQSYFLGMINPDIIHRLFFPLGDKFKTEVIEYAKKRGIVSGHVSESQDICFIQGKGRGGGPPPSQWRRCSRWGWSDTPQRRCPRLPSAWRRRASPAPACSRGCASW